ncbi:MAG: caspase family protein [Thermoguttaceae bacterium]|nr:caspase family protein [Thermoguttaceae bacterium]
MNLRTKSAAIIAAVIAFIAVCSSGVQAGWVKVQDSPITIYRDTRTGLEWSVTIARANNNHDYAKQVVQKYGLRLPTWNELRDVVNNNDAIDWLDIENGLLDLYETNDPSVLAGAYGGSIDTKRPRQPLITQTWVLGVRSSGCGGGGPVQPVNPHQKVYVFCEGDYNDSKIGRAVEVSTNDIHSLFKWNLPEQQIVIYNDSNEWTGPDFRTSGDNVADDIMTAIRNCPAGPSDTIVFYWFCHGSFDERGHVLWLSANRKISMYRSKLRNALLAKNARLTVLMTEACHSYYPMPIQSLPAAAKVVHNVPPLFNTLFFNNSGLVDFNTSSPGQTSWCHTNLGGFFTHFFCDYIWVHLDNAISWKTLLDNVQSDVLNYPDYRTPNNKMFRHTHHYYYWSLPGCDDRIVNQKWSEPNYHPRNGDRITYVNNNEIQDEDHFRQVIRDSDRSRVVLNIVDRKTGKTYYMMTDLEPQGSTSRLGIYVEDAPQGGVTVTGVMSGTPGERCRFLDNGDCLIGYSEPKYYPENEDRIIAVNNTEIWDEDHFRQVIRDSETRVILTVIDHESGDRYYLMTSLNPKGSTSRLGIYVEDSPEGGVSVTGFMSGSPGARCRYRKE